MLIYYVVEDGYHKNRIPYIVLACKSDLPHLISPADSSNVASKYDGGIVELANNGAGRDKTKRCVGVLLRGVCRRRCWFFFLLDH